ncbi:DJ-1/PfpI family protein [Costertonia aggregata]|uniref:DJ-1/PfpI family protein n=2 Tax=Costertonia aggregata TaxID=343403 RepID=A0A7H9AWF5_9FLAO|nr:DJ-1/PfpI family protein [Costertonia aggregata]
MDDTKETIPEKRNVKPDGSKYTIKELENMTHDELMALTYEAPRDTIFTIGILLYDGYFSLDAMGPHSVFSSMYPAKTFFIAKEKGLIQSNNGLKTQVDTTIAEVKHLDILVVPGGTADTYRATKDQKLLNWIRQIDQNSKYTTSVCTGAWILGAAGLLKGKKATTNWYDAENKLKGYGATFVNKRYTNDGKYWTSAGVSAGIDMSLALVDHTMGRNYADFVMLNLEYDPAPPFEGGSPEKTDPVVTYMTKKMYDFYIEPVIKELNP